MGSSTPKNFLKKKDALAQREPQQTPGAYPRHPQTLKWKEFLHKQVVEGLGYVPGVCWKILRLLGMWEVPSFRDLWVQNGRFLIFCFHRKRSSFTVFFVSLLKILGCRRLVNEDRKYLYTYAFYYIIKNKHATHAPIYIYVCCINTVCMYLYIKLSLHQIVA